VTFIDKLTKNTNDSHSNICRDIRGQYFEETPSMDFDEIIMVKVAWYYYMESMTQQEIAELLLISRTRVIKLLERARSSGVVQFSIRHDRVRYVETERKLVNLYGLSDALVAPSALKTENINENVAKAAAMYIVNRLKENDFINVGYGDTSGKLLNRLATMAEHPLSCVSLTGGVNNYLPNARSNVFNARLFLMPTPLVASSPEMAAAMRDEASVKEIFRMINLAAMTAVGIGGMAASATILKEGLLNRGDFTLLQMQGAVGDILSHFIDRKGGLVQTQIEDRLISTPLHVLKELRNVIGVAAGCEKTEAIAAALRGGYINILITDEATARALCDA
jgi:DNA-binding transcriptional regulator LsrR (DeoR family)